mgnify:CR=1 FL=1
MRVASAQNRDAKDDAKEAKIARDGRWAPEIAKDARIVDQDETTVRRPCCAKATAGSPVFRGTPVQWATMRNA